MEEVQNEKKSKSAKTSKMTTLRLQKETKKKIVSELAKMNKKDFGKKVRVDEFLNVALSLIGPEHLKKLQEGSLSNADRLERDYKDYISKFEHISKDEYLGKRLNGEIGSAAFDINQSISDKKD